jgi:glycosyltransferase involved in cell wall biosynthesis
VYRRIEGAARETRPTLVHFGRVRRYKGIDVVIRAFALARRSLADARLLIIGDGPELPRLRALVRRLGLADAVEFTGRMGAEAMVERLNRCHVFLNASPKEGWGLTVVEANACGVPVVGSDRPGLRDSIQDGVTGFLASADDPASFARRALDLLGDRALWERMGKAGMEWAGSLTWERTADEMEAAFLRACAPAAEGDKEP